MTVTGLRACARCVHGGSGREALKAVPSLETSTFVDLGCGKGRPLLVASEYPFNCFDASSLLTRCFARQIPYTEEELGYGPDESDAVIIWQGGTALPPLEAANARLVTVTSGFRVILENAWVPNQPSSKSCDREL